MTFHVSPTTVGVCAQPVVFAFLAANAPWIVTVVTGILASVWYARQLYKDFKVKGKDDEASPRS